MVNFEMVGGRTCLDFVNTESQGGGERIDRIGTYPELVQWARKAGALDGGGARKEVPRQRHTL